MISLTKSQREVVGFLRNLDGSSRFAIHASEESNLTYPGPGLGTVRISGGVEEFAPQPCPTCDHQALPNRHTFRFEWYHNAFKKVEYRCNSRLRTFTSIRAVMAEYERQRAK